mmetsp:Transcript_117553/g.332578  ORF Transcript_117553/g.332578 Transcript_117553/m.332578 type:complete len:216 (+) Transcript_117553:1193-1840(+)
MDEVASATSLMAKSTAQSPRWRWSSWSPPIDDEGFVSCRTAFFALGDNEPRALLCRSASGTVAGMTTFCTPSAGLAEGGAKRSKNVLITPPSSENSSSTSSSPLARRGASMPTWLLASLGQLLWTSCLLALQGAHLPSPPPPVATKVTAAALQAATPALKRLMASSSAAHCASSFWHSSVSPFFAPSRAESTSASSQQPLCRSERRRSYSLRRAA